MIINKIKENTERYQIRYSFFNKAKRIFLVAVVVSGIGGYQKDVVFAQEYRQENSVVPIEECVTPPVQQDKIVQLNGNRAVLVSSWMSPDTYKLQGNRIEELVKWVDKSTCSKTPLTSGCKGLISKGIVSSQHAEWGFKDYIVVTEKLILWFDFTPEHMLSTPGNILPNGGGGMLRGVWTVKEDSSGSLNFEDIRNGSNWAPNMLLPGANGDNLQGGGISMFITDHSADDGHVYNVENDTNAYLSHHGPIANIELGSKGDLTTQGLFIRAIGKFVDTENVGNRYILGDEKKGSIRAETTWRIPACDRSIFLDTMWINESSSRVGPVVNMLMATNTYGEPNPVRRDGALLNITSTSKDTCVVRRRWKDTNECHSGIQDYMDYEGHGQEYRPKASINTAPPIMTLHSRETDGSVNDSWAISLQSLSGVVTNGLIFDIHSMGKLVSAFDATLFNSEFWESADKRATVVDYNLLPKGIERIDKKYYIKPNAAMGMRAVLSFYEGIKIDKPTPTTSVPDNCKIWFDGCNTCTRNSEGGVMGCTKKACKLSPDTKAYCKEYFTNTSTDKKITADVNQDGKITVVDAVLTLKKSVGYKITDLKNMGWNDTLTTGDVNCDNKVTVVDAVLVLKKSVGYKTEDLKNMGWCVE